MKEFSIENLLASAKTQAGFSDFGEDFSYEGLKQLLAGINNCGNLKSNRVEHLAADIERMLVNALRRQQDLENHPEISEQKLVSPLTIVSLPRTGTTKLQRVLGATGAFQETLYWYCYMPSAIQDHDNYGSRQRISLTQKYCDWRLQADPDIQLTHTLDTFLADEDMFLVESCFRSPGLAFLHQSPEYGGWLAGEDLSKTYDFLRSQLQYLQWQFDPNNARPWLLKSPAHLGNEDQLTRIYQGENHIICPHREPAQVFPSICRLFESWIGLYYEMPVPKEQFGPVLLQNFSQSMQAHMAWRDRNKDIEVLDMSFTEICRDSLSSVGKVFDFVGMELTQQHEQGIRAWDSANPRHKEGRAKLSLEEYGLNEFSVNEAFAEYRERFAKYM